MNGFSAADMSTAAASAHKTGYQAGYADAKPAAAQEAAWKLAQKVRTELDRASCPDAFMRIAVEAVMEHATAPVAASQVDTWFADQLTAMGEVIPLASTPAAPGIDLEQFRALVEACEDMRVASEECDVGEGLAHAVPFHLWNAFLSRLDASQQVIDASPKGGSTDAECRASAWQTAFDSSVATHKRNKSRTWVLTCMREHFERLYSELQATSAEAGE